MGLRTLVGEGDLRLCFLGGGEGDLCRLGGEDILLLEGETESLFFLDDREDGGECLLDFTGLFGLTALRFLEDGDRLLDLKNKFNFDMAGFNQLALLHLKHEVCYSFKVII